MLPLDPPVSPTSLRTERNLRVAGAPGERALLRDNKEDPEALRRFASHLLTDNPDSITARLILSGLAQTEAETEILLRDAVRIGVQVWQRELSGEVDVAWFDEPSTRMFMTAISNYGRTLSLRGLHAEAERCAEFLLVLDPRDRLKARELTRPGGAVSDGVVGPRF